MRHYVLELERQAKKLLMVDIPCTMSDGNGRGSEQSGRFPGQRWQLVAFKTSLPTLLYNTARSDL